MKTFPPQFTGLARTIGASSFPCLLLGIATMAGGCASFEHQTTESEPHSVVRFVRAGDSGAPRREPSSIDGQSVRNGKDYRVRPGEHTVVFRFVEKRVNYQ